MSSSPLVNWVRRALSFRSRPRRIARNQDCRFESLEPRILLVFSLAPAGGEFQVNTATAGNQETDSQSVAADAAGDFVVVWQSAGQDGSGVGIHARRFNAAGAALGAEFQVNTFTAGDQSNPVVAMDAAGDFVIAWQSQGQDGSGLGIYAQRYNAAGAARGTEFRVNTLNVGDQSNPAIASDSAGDFIVAWQSAGQDGSGLGVSAQRYDAGGAAEGGEFQVNGYTVGDQSNPSVAMDPLGHFVVAWQSAGQDGSGEGVYARRYDASGLPLADEFQVNDFTVGDQSNPSVAMSASGRFDIAWQSAGQDGSGVGILARSYSPGGTPDDEFRANVYTTGDQSRPSVSDDAAGDPVIAWQSAGQDGSGDGVYALIGKAEVRLNTVTAGSQRSPAVALDAFGNAVFAWSSAGQGGSGAGVFAQRFARTDAVATLSSAPNVTAAGNGTYTFQVTYAAQKGINISTLGDANLVVQGPDLVTRNATFVAVDSNQTGTPRTATYRMTVPNHTGWTLADTGKYLVEMGTKPVQDTAGMAVAGSEPGLPATLGEFYVFPVSFPSNSRNLQVTATGENVEVLDEDHNNQVLKTVSLGTPLEVLGNPTGDNTLIVDFQSFVGNSGVSIDFVGMAGERNVVNVSAGVASTSIAAVGILYSCAYPQGSVKISAPLATAISSAVVVRDATISIPGNYLGRLTTDGSSSHLTGQIDYKGAGVTVLDLPNPTHSETVTLEFRKQTLPFGYIVGNPLQAWQIPGGLASFTVNSSHADSSLTIVPSATTPVQFAPLYGDSYSTLIVDETGVTSTVLTFGADRSGQVTFGNRAPVTFPSDHVALVNTDFIERLYRAYNPNNGQHFYTSSFGEFTALTHLGLNNESTDHAGFAVFQNGSGGNDAVPLHRLYNPNGGQHYYTTSNVERDALARVGWTVEPDQGMLYPPEDKFAGNGAKVYHVYNSVTGEHLFFASVDDMNAQIAADPAHWVEQTPLGYAIAVPAEEFPASDLETQPASQAQDHLASAPSASHFASLAPSASAEDAAPTASMSSQTNLNGGLIAATSRAPSSGAESFDKTSNSVSSVPMSRFPAGSADDMDSAWLDLSQQLALSKLHDPFGPVG